MFSFITVKKTVKYTADRTFYMIVFSTDKTVSVFTWVYRKNIKNCFLDFIKVKLGP